MRRNIIKYTNKHGLPEAVFQALTRDEYSKGDGDYSVTEILNPPQIVQLKRRYSDQITEDVMDMVWSVMGKAAHHILESHAPEDSLSEERLYVDILGRKLGGQVDNYHDGVITDYKITSAFTLVYGSRINEWTEQLNAYAYIFRQNGYPVHKLQIVTILRDWNKNKALQDRQYPQTPIVVLPITLWDEEKQAAFLWERMYLHTSAETFTDEDLSIGMRCMPDEMWEQETKYAVMMEGRKAALRVFQTEDECLSFIDNAGYSDNTKVSIVARPGRRVRCEEYCVVKDFCHQHKEATQ